MITEAALADFVAAGVRIGTPLLLAALGEMIAERAGVINLGVEGAMLAGALAAAIGAAGGDPLAGMAWGTAAGLLLSACFAAAVIGAGTNQIITGTAVSLGAIGATGMVYRQAYGTPAAGTLVTLTPLELPVLREIPLLGTAAFAQPVSTYVGFALVPLAWYLLFRTRVGLALRAAGESAELAAAAGVRVKALRWGATLTGGALAGLAGATLVLAQVGSFAERMTAGRGYVAVAIVVLGRWHPVGVLLAALAFGLASALQYLFQTAGTALPYQIFLILPYVITLLALAGVVGKARAPADLGR